MKRPSLVGVCVGAIAGSLPRAPDERLESERSQCLYLCEAACCLERRLAGRLDGDRLTDLHRPRSLPMLLCAGLATITPCAGYARSYCGVPSPSCGAVIPASPTYSRACASRLALCRFVRPWAAFVIGILAAVFCYACCELKNMMKWDDALDVWGVHGMGGALGSVLIGVFADNDVGGVASSGELVGKQLVAVLFAAVFSYISTIAILLVVGCFFRLKPNVSEITDLDFSFHGETAYDPEMNDSKYAGTAVDTMLHANPKPEATAADVSAKG